MNDRYLYRAKREDNREQIIGYLYRLSENHPPFIMLCDRYGESHEVDESTICKCTGLRDNTRTAEFPEGKLIWENDVVAFLDTYSTESGWAEQNCIGKVVWDDETLSLQVTNRLSAESYEVLEDCRVLGNTIDNPELLEVGE